MRMGVLMVPPHPTAVIRRLDGGGRVRLASGGRKAVQGLPRGEGEGWMIGWRSTLLVRGERTHTSKGGLRGAPS